MESIASQLRGWRETTGIGRHEAAQRLGVSKRVVESWEQGRREPGPHRDRVLSVISGFDGVEPNLVDANKHLAAARDLIKRTLSAGSPLLGAEAKDRIERLWKRLGSDSEELTTLAASVSDRIGSI